jgi:GTP-binding protein
VKEKDVPARIAGVKASLARRPAAYPDVILTSSRTGAGLPELRAAIAALLAKRA